MFDFSNTRVLIVGDVMLDKYWHGGTARISPEAPVPVVHVERVYERPGGAANVAMNIAALGGFARVVGLTGNDEAADVLDKLLTSEQVECIFNQVAHPTITKMRILSRNQQLLRLDIERDFEFETNPSFNDSYLAALVGVQAVVLSDYGKGTLRQPQFFIEAARQNNLPVLVDPKRSDFSYYHGATLITPNMKEFEAVVGHWDSLSHMEEKARQVLEAHDFGALLVTRGDQGMSLIERKASAIHIPALAREVYDVTGAGDTVIATLATCVASGMEFAQAANIANVAASIVVGKVGTSTVTTYELQAVIDSHKHLPASHPIVTEDVLVEVLSMCKAQGERIVFTNGCFDILHAGHVMYLEQAKRLGDRLIVAVNSDDSVKRLKGSTRPINNLESRMAVLAGLKSVDWVVSFSEDTPERLIRRLDPHVMVKGGDYKRIEELPGAAWVLDQGGQVKILDLKAGCSTTRIVEIITANA